MIHLPSESKTAVLRYISIKPVKTQTVKHFCCAHACLLHAYRRRKASGPACSYKFKELRRRPLPEKPTARDDGGDRSTVASSGPLSASFLRAAALGRRVGIPSSGSAYRLVLIA